MHLIHATGLSKAHADRHVLREADLSVLPGEVVGLVGPNGSGKSTLLRLLAKADEADGGSVIHHGTVAFLRQEPELDGTTVGEATMAALAWHSQLLEDWKRATDAHDDDAMGRIAARLDVVGWDLEHRAHATLHRLAAPPWDAEVSTLSGGERRRVALARVLLSEPEVLLLDEPTNHLDAETVDNLQDDLIAFKGAVVLVTHDRYLLEAVATRIVEVDDGVTVSYDGSYGDYLVARAERQASMSKAEDARLGMIAREAEWASRSPAARSTKQRARLERLDALREKRPMQRTPSLSLDLSTGLKQGQTVLEATGLAKAWDGRPIFSGVDLSLLRGERLGILGPNGAGKSTLLHILAGTVQPDAGEIRLSPRVKAALLDQHRSGLTPGDTVYDAAGDGNEQVQIGETWVHVRGLLERFLFKRPMHAQKVDALSGGERARLLLVKTMLQGANLLLLDEPTNDLDLMTLRVLEEALLSFDGSAVVVTHDRAFLDRVCTSVLSFEPDGTVVRYASRQQVARAHTARAAQEAQARKEASAKAAPTPPTKVVRSGAKLSYNDKKDLEELPARIEALECEVEALEGRMADPATWTELPADEARALGEALAAKQAEVDAAYTRWTELEERAGA